MKATFFIAAALSLVNVATAATAPVSVGSFAPVNLEDLLLTTLNGLVGTLSATTLASCAVSPPHSFSISRPGDYADIGTGPLRRC